MVKSDWSPFVTVEEEELPIFWFLLFYMHKR